MTTRAAAPWLGRTSSRTPYLLAAGAALVTLALRLHDPHVHGSWGLCPVRALTGWDCPGCGGLRAVNDLTHGDLGAAAHSNLYFVASIPVLLATWLWWARGARRPLPRRLVLLRPWLLGVWAAVGVAFTLWRNTPWGHAFWA